MTEGPFEGPRFVDLLSLFRGTMGITANLPGVTIQRIRGTLQWADTVDVTPINSSGMLFGIVKGNLSPPTGVDAPSALPNDDWMLFDWQPVSMPHAGGARSGRTELLSSLTFDVRSRRRLDEPAETIWLALDPSDTRTGSAVNVFGWVSVLIALP